VPGWSFQVELLPQLKSKSERYKTKPITLLPKQTRGRPGKRRRRPRPVAFFNYKKTTNEQTAPKKKQASTFKTNQLHSYHQKHPYDA
jgi:hypothetical protein